VEEAEPNVREAFRESLEGCSLNILSFDEVVRFASCVAFSSFLSEKKMKIIIFIPRFTFPFFLWCVLFYSAVWG
jgi:hypothetical protein